MTARFRDQTVVVTGGSRGLGAALATGFAAEGARVVLTYRVQEKKAARVVTRILETGGEATAHKLDVRDRDGVEALFDTIGPVDVLINNAGLVRVQSFAMDDPDAWSEVLAVNLEGAARCARAAVRPMLARGRGAIVNVSSPAALRGVPGHSAYSAAKGGLIALTRSLAAELAPGGIRVNAVLPGLLDTGMAGRMPPRLRERWLSHLPIGRVGRAEEVVKATLFLASDDASYVVGHTLVIDGGLCL